jgi:hypothetical protein
VRPKTEATHEPDVWWGPNGIDAQSWGDGGQPYSDPRFPDVAIEHELVEPPDPESRIDLGAGRP